MIISDDVYSYPNIMYFFLAEVERPIHSFRVLSKLKYYLIKVKEAD